MHADEAQRRNNVPACRVAQNHADRDFDTFDDLETPHTLVIHTWVKYRPKHDKSVVPPLDKLARQGVPTHTNMQSGK